MNTKAQDELIAAATAVIERWDSPLWKDKPHTAECINRLRDAIASQEQQDAVAVQDAKDVEIARLRTAIQQTLDENGHLADGENCTLILLKRALTGE